MQYEIEKAFILNLPQIPFRYDKPEGVVMHATAVFGDSARSERGYEVLHWKDAFVHAFVDHKEILQIADTDYIAYGAGSVANQRFLHIELCQSTDREKFKAAYDRWTWLAAFWLRSYGLQPIEGETIWSHHMVTERLGGSTHTDPDEYLAYHGYTWENAVQDIKTHYEEMEGGDMNEPQITEGAAQKVIDILSAVYGACNDEDVQNAAHYAANALREAAGISGEEE